MILILSIIFIQEIICLEENIYNSIIYFSNEKINITGEGSAKENKGSVKILEPGSYLLTGASNEGNVIIDSSSVYLYLENLVLSSNGTSPIIIENKKNDVKIIAIQNVTLNDLEDPDTTTGECATIKIKKRSQVTFENQKDFKLTGKCKNVIKGGQNVSIIFESSDGEYIIEAYKNAISSDGLIKFKGGIFNITSESEDGIASIPEKDDIYSLSHIIIDGGLFIVRAYQDAFQAKNLILINNGTFDIKTENGYQSTTFNKSNDNANGFKVSNKDIGNAIIVYNGDFLLNTADNAFHSSGNLSLINGNFCIYSKEVGLHAKYNIFIGKIDTIGPNINILNSYEAIEGSSIRIDSGNLYLFSSDDGMNAAGVSDDKEILNPNNIISIYGGEINIFSDGDGLDSNGNIFIYGGDINIFSKETGEKPPIDCDGNFSIFNTTILCIGSKGLNYLHHGIINGNQLYAYFNESIKENRIVKILNEKNMVVKEENITKNIDYIFYTSPYLNQNYSLNIFNPIDNSEKTYILNFGNMPKEGEKEENKNKTITNSKKKTILIIFLIIFPLFIIIILIIIYKRYFCNKKHDEFVIDNINKELSSRISIEETPIN